ncbi:MAG: helix-turn-helix domain-containing protein [Gemmatimonadales bacterium]
MLVEYGLAGSYEPCDLVEDLLRHGRSATILAVVVDTSDSRGRPTAPALVLLRKERPVIPALVWCPIGDANATAFRDLISAGVSAVLFRNAGPLEARVLGQFIPRDALPYDIWIEQALERRVPVHRSIVAACLKRETARLTVPQVARRLGIPTRTLAHHLAQAGLPPASELLKWGRVLAAAWDIAHTGSSVERIAHEHSFASAGSLRAMLKRWTTDVPSDLRRPERFGWVLRCFEHELTRRKHRTTEA